MKRGRHVSMACAHHWIFPEHSLLCSRACHVAQGGWMRVHGDAATHVTCSSRIAGRNPRPSATSGPPACLVRSPVACFGICTDLFPLFATLSCTPSRVCATELGQNWQGGDRDCRLTAEHMDGEAATVVRLPCLVHHHHHHHQSLLVKPLDCFRTTLL